MTADRTSSLRLLCALVLTAAFSCAREAPPPAAAADKQFDFGTRRVQVTVPAGWETLDQGAVKRIRKGESEIVLQFLTLGSRSDGNFDEIIDWALSELRAGVGHDQQREVKSRHAVTIDGREAMDIESWSRLDHSNPQRIFFVRDEGDLLALQTVGMALAGTLTSFDAVRGSLHFPSAGR
jgi:hypothetical protein